MQMPHTVPRIDPALAVNDVLRRWPVAVRTLNAYGIDTCCGGSLSLEQAAGEVGISVDVLIAAISIDATHDVAPTTTDIP